jgi:hypothetical protein
MAVEDYLEPEVGVAVAVTVALASPRARRVMRRGAVYGLAGVLKAGDALGSFTRGVGRGVQQAAAGAADTAETVAAGDNGATTERPATRPRSTRSARANATPADQAQDPETQTGGGAE